MTRLYLPSGECKSVTVLSIDNLQVVSTKTTDKHGYDAVQLGIGAPKPKNVTKAMKGYFAQHNVPAKRVLKEFRVANDALLQPGQELSAAHYLVGQYVDVTGVTIGKGFAGVMKRHNFGGLRASHGVSISHRSHGSTGGRQDPGKVFKGKKMAGHMGQVQVTQQNLQIAGIDEARGLILIDGAVPGADEGYVFIKDAVKKAAPKELPYPAAIKTGAAAPVQAVAEEPAAQEAQAEVAALEADQSAE